VQPEELRTKKKKKKPHEKDRSEMKNSKQYNK
jgi:hypothetical protein